MEPGRRERGSCGEQEGGCVRDELVGGERPVGGLDLVKAA